MAKPPQSTPHSDLDGVHQDERPNVETAQETGETPADLERTSKESKARPPYSEEESRERAR